MIYLVRHGQSEWNLERRTQGQIAHPPLTELGLRQAAAAGAAIAADLARRDLSDSPLDAIVTSDATRAVQTAQAIAGALPAPIRVDVSWREQALGEFEGLDYDETLRRGAELDWSDPDLPVGGGESQREMEHRVAEAWAGLGVHGAGPIVVVSHGDTIRAVLGWLAGFVAGEVPWTAVGNGSVAAIEDRLAIEDGSAPRWLEVEPSWPAVGSPTGEPGQSPASAARPGPCLRGPGAR